MALKDSLHKICTPEFEDISILIGAEAMLGRSLVEWADNKSFSFAWYEFLAFDQTSFARILSSYNVYFIVDQDNWEMGSLRFHFDIK